MNGRVWGMAGASGESRRAIMDITEILRSVLALIFVLGLVLGCAALARARGWLTPGGVPAADKRLRQLESLVLDPRHRLLLVSIDEREHLILVGATSSQILPVPPAPPAPSTRPGETS